MRGITNNYEGYNCWIFMYKGWKTCLLIILFCCACLREALNKFSGFYLLNFCLKNIKKGWIQFPFGNTFHFFPISYKIISYVRLPVSATQGGATVGRGGAHAPMAPPHCTPLQIRKTFNCCFVEEIYFIS